MTRLSLDEIVDLYLGQDEADLIESVSAPLDPFTRLRLLDEWIEESAKGMVLDLNDVTFAIKFCETSSRMLGEACFDIGWGFRNLHQDPDKFNFAFSFSKGTCDRRLTVSELRSVEYQQMAIIGAITKYGHNVVFTIGSGDGQDERRLSLYKKILNRYGFDFTPLKAIVSPYDNAVSNCKESFAEEIGSKLYQKISKQNIQVLRTL